MAGETAGTATTAVATPAASQPTVKSEGAITSEKATTGASSSTGSAPLKAPLIPDPKEFLERARARRGLPPRQDAAGKPAAPAEPAKPAAPAAVEPAKPSVQAGEAKDAAKPAEKPPEAKPVEDPKDDLAARVAKFSREEREFAQRRAAFEQEQARAKAEREEAAKQHEAKLKQAETVEKATKALESGDIAGTIRLLKADVNPSAIALQFLEQLQREDERPMSAAEVDRIVAERLKAESEARAKSEEEKRKADEEKKKTEGMTALETARENYMQACSSVFSREKHPFIAAYGLRREDVIAYAESQRDSNGRIAAPDPEELVNHFETQMRKRAESAGWAPRATEVPKPAPTPSFSQTAMAQDSGGRLVADAPPKTLEQIRSERKLRLRMGGSQT